jgi:hypothetical protein
MVFVERQKTAHGDTRVWSDNPVHSMQTAPGRQQE